MGKLYSLHECFEPPTDVSSGARHKVPKSASDRAVETVGRDVRQQVEEARKFIPQRELSKACTLDLHGKQKEEALLDLELFFAEANAYGREFLCIVTGRGINSLKNPRQRHWPVLKITVGRKLEEFKKKGIIADFASEESTHGGSYLVRMPLK